MKKSEVKFRSYISIGWGVLVLFLLIGMMLGRQEAIYGMIIAAECWVVLRIIREALDSVNLLRAINNDKHTNDESE
jgi:hypothetical protein